ncbi:nucleotide-binding protein, PIN domain-containing protein [Spirosoma sp. HMF3257]|uniref:Nucleotide-binding protein, PIN domain-containing protein n=1 Tax=Spirosoma telluris TaxID=2183553 RepID=A0A327NMN1_9BACT|nr:nucleotide-binding protein, PIN domain-containing protein [Spirosoma telluris]RAI75649.1 nucleotide-binding protein, PIN domain-containing protein [Spirosoma telluris]
MKKVIIDHNILFAAIHTNTSYTRQRLLDSPLAFYTPNYLIVELFKHRQRIVEKSKATEEDVLSYLNQVIQKVHFFNEELISLENFFTAYHLCKGVDENDTAYVALTLELDGELWTRDEELKAGLRLRGFDRFFNETAIK